jgi:hypothetical protein
VVDGHSKKYRALIVEPLNSPQFPVGLSGCGEICIIFWVPHRVLRGCESADDETGGQDGGESILALGEGVHNEVVMTGDVEYVQVQLVFYMRILL